MMMLGESKWCNWKKKEKAK